MKKNNKDIVLFVNSLPASAAEAVKDLGENLGRELQIALIRQKRKHEKETPERIDILLECDFSDAEAIGKVLLPYQNRFLCISCRSDSNIARFMQIIPQVPYLRTPTTESLRWATDKYEMRKRMRLYDPKHTPKFKLINDATKKEIDSVIDTVGFPMVIKPTNLAQSQLVSICFHEDELHTIVKSAFRKLRSTYVKNKRIEQPKLMAEEYMEGDMYSIDSYVDSRGRITHCPLVRVKTGKDIGHDDFYNYLRITPTNLKPTTVAIAQEVAEKAIHALCLRNTSVHTELIKADNDWKIIELGPRIGGFRHEMYQLSCDINHGLNDLMVRIPKKVIVPKKCKGYSATMRYYPNTEGYITSISGLKRIKKLDSTVDINVKLKVGEKSLYSKNGGKGIFDLTMYNKERHLLLADIRRVEKVINVKVSTKKQVR